MLEFLIALSSSNFMDSWGPYKSLHTTLVYVLLKGVQELVYSLASFIAT